LGGRSEEETGEVGGKLPRDLKEATSTWKGTKTVGSRTLRNPLQIGIGTIGENYYLARLQTALFSGQNVKRKLILLQPSKTRAAHKEGTYRGRLQRLRRKRPEKAESLKKNIHQGKEKEGLANRRKTSKHRSQNTGLLWKAGRPDEGISSVKSDTTERKEKSTT